jgi:hypothetical protein
MGPHIIRLVLGVALLIGGTAVAAQVTVTPESLRVVVVQEQELTMSVILANDGAANMPFCVDFDRPIQRTGNSVLGAGCGPPGELLQTFDSIDLGRGWLPYGVTMTPEGRLFVAEWSGGLVETHELTADLVHVRRFPHPTVSELSPFPTTTGVTYRPDTGTLWWTNTEESAGTLYRVMLLEGSLNGIPTGRRIVLPIPPTGPPPTNSGYPAGASYDPASGRFYYADILNDSLWAIDTTGAVADGYPVALEAYPGLHYVGNVVDAHGGAAGGAGGVRLELAVGFEFSNVFDLVTVTDSAGSDLGYDETPLAQVLALNNGTANVSGTARGRLDPNGVLYVTYWTPGPSGVAAVRPVPLAPSWLALSAWSGTVPAGSGVEVTLTFSAGQREPGEYRSTLVVEDTAGVVLASVPLIMVVEAGTPTEPGPQHAGSLLSVWPNPVHDAGAVTLTAPAVVAAARVAAFDVLGREVRVLHEGPLPAGVTRLAMDADSLPAGVYVIRASAAGWSATRTFSVAR